MARSHNQAAAATLERVQVCLACSTTTPEGSGRFCPECGAVLTQSMAAAETDVPGNKLSVSATVAPADDAGSLVGTKVDGFAIEGVIGGGSFGTVYRGRQTGLDRVVAIKVPTYEIAADPVMAKRFAREARSAARIVHPGVVSIYAVGELPDGRPYLAMQLVDGEPLDRILSNGPVAVSRALRLVRQIASALSDTHAAGVVHRDLKPTNIMWRRDRNGDDRITLVDFGIAVCKPGNADATRLTAGNLIGTPHYMSPEQAHGEVVDARADLYALGCLLHELLTGETPYTGSGVEVLLAHLGRPAPRPSERNANVPEGVDRLVLALMAKKPDERVASADALVELIDDALDALGDHDEPPATDKPRAKRKTASTRKDKPPIPIPRSALEPLDPPVPHTPLKSRATWMAAGAALAFVISVAAVLVVRLVAGPPATAGNFDDRAGSQSQQPTRPIFRDDGEMRLRLWVPEPFYTGKARVRIELRNKLGAPIVTETLLVTVEDPTGTASAIKARPRQDDETQFGFAFEPKIAGTYHIRIFPPEDAARSPSTFTIPVDVVAR
jgi:serine/threonine protein kinase